MATEKRLIDLDKLIAYFEEMYYIAMEDDDPVSGYVMAALGSCLEYFKTIPTVDAVEVAHGRWVQCGEPDEDGNGQYHCSVCLAGETHNPIVEVPYCWKCGAKMDGDSSGGCKSG